VLGTIAGGRKRVGLGKDIWLGCCAVVALLLLLHQWSCNSCCITSSPLVSASYCMVVSDLQILLGVFSHQVLSSLHPKDGSSLWGNKTDVFIQAVITILGSILPEYPLAPSKRGAILFSHYPVHVIICRLGRNAPWVLVRPHFKEAVQSANAQRTLIHHNLLLPQALQYHMATSVQVVPPAAALWLAAAAATASPSPHPLQTLLLVTAGAAVTLYGSLCWVTWVSGVVRWRYLWRGVGAAASLHQDLSVGSSPPAHWGEHMGLR
jgi:hypothetical protein